ncbi:MAG: hypothetical protein DME60_13250 [Verrucomicrobia bacterium]|nr:MAG: hypothetical protein DME60_13250 [Verrucomicrobiota bacterium]
MLPNDKVLVAAGVNYHTPEQTLDSAELYDPASGTWMTTGSLIQRRGDHTATLLPNGKVLVAGGSVILQGAVASCELYDPASGTWTMTGSLHNARVDHTATLLPNGNVLVTGGLNLNENDQLTSAEVYDPASGTWTEVASLATKRDGHTATLLPNGKVLVAGGYNFDILWIARAELYDPANGTWQRTGSLATTRGRDAATLLPNGRVLVEGGYTGGFPGVPTETAELYDPASGTWQTTSSLATARAYHTATLLPNGKVLVATGYGIGGAYTPSAELYDVGLGFSSDWQPVIERAPRRLISGNPLRLTGSLFQGISQASSGNTQDSSSNYPIVQLRSIENSQVAFLPVDPVAGWSDTSFTSVPVTGFPLGPALVTVFTNGIPSTAKPLIVAKHHH